jgi:hypothetical protein
VPAKRQETSSLAAGCFATKGEVCRQDRRRQSPGIHPAWFQISNLANQKMIIRAEIEELARLEPPLSPTAIAKQVSGQYDVIVPIAVAVALGLTP